MIQPVSKYEMILIGGSSGSLVIVMDIIESLSADFKVPFAIVLHQLKGDSNLLKFVLSNKTKIEVIEPVDKEAVYNNKIYIAPPDYHLMIEKNKSFSYSFDEPINYSRPSIDLLFETAAGAYKDKLIGILLSGANADGAEGLKKIKSNGGLTIVQDPATAEYSYMPNAAIKKLKVDLILSIDEIKKFLAN